MFNLKITKINIIHESSTQLLNLINRILEFRKTETQNRQLSISKGNLAQLVQEIGLRYKELYRNPKIKFNVRINTEATELFFDAEILTIIMDNLLSNAGKYTSEGEITLCLSSVQEEDIQYSNRYQYKEEGYAESSRYVRQRVHS